MPKASKSRPHRSYKPLPEGDMTIASLAREFAITDNSKAGVAFDMPALISCPGKTLACSAEYIKKDGTPSATFKKCYATLAPYGWAQPLYRRNMDLIQKALIQGMTPADIAAAVARALTGKKSRAFVPRIRIHGSGDIWSVEYCIVLQELCKKLTEKQFWLYTRSWAIPTLLPSIIELAKQPNIDVNLSADYINYQDCADVFLDNPVFRNIACMQEADATWIWTLLAKGVNRNQIVIFPEHSRNDRFVEPLRGAGRICPAILGAFKHDEAGGGLPACLQCKNICVS